MKTDIYHFLQWLQLMALLLPALLVCFTQTRHHLLWLFAAYFAAHFLIELVLLIADSSKGSVAFTMQLNTVINIINMFDGVWCMLIVHYAASCSRLKRWAGIGASALFLFQLLYAQVVGVDGTTSSAAYAVGVSLLVTFCFQLAWLGEYYRHTVYNGRQKAAFLLCISMVINYGASFCPYFFVYLQPLHNNFYIEQQIMQQIPNIVYALIASMGVWLYSTGGGDTANAR